MVSLLIQLIGILPGLGGAAALPAEHPVQRLAGAAAPPIDWAPIVRAAWVCALYGVPALVAAMLVFLRRDVAGG